MALDGEAAVVTYDSSVVSCGRPFTQDHDVVERAIAGVKFEAPERRLYDGMDLAVRMLERLRRQRWRRIMLIVGESEDGGSDAKLGAIARAAEHANISIYAAGPSSVGRDLLTDAAGLWAAPAIFLLQEGKNKIKNHDLEVATAATGGIHYRAIHASTVEGAVDKIGGELHAQYIISYRPNAERTPGFHSVTVTVSRPDILVRTRPGYYVAPPVSGGP